MGSDFLNAEVVFALKKRLGCAVLAIRHGEHRPEVLKLVMITDYHLPHPGMCAPDFHHRRKALK